MRYAKKINGFEKGDNWDRIGNWRKFKSQQIIYNCRKIEIELDLNDLIYNVPKLKHASKMKYLDKKERYEAQLRQLRKCLGDKVENNDHNTTHTVAITF